MGKTNPYESPNVRILKPIDIERKRPWFFIVVAIGLVSWGSLVSVLGFFVGIHLLISGFTIAGIGLLNLAIGLNSTTNSSEKLVVIFGSTEAIAGIIVAILAFKNGGMQAFPMVVFIVFIAVLLFLSSGKTKGSKGVGAH